MARKRILAAALCGAVVVAGAAPVAPAQQQGTKAEIPEEWRRTRNEAEAKARERLEGKPAPSIAPLSQWMNTDARSWEDLRGKVVLLDFWATWCAPCVAAMPFLQRVADKFEDQPFVLIGINQDAAGDEMEGRVKRFLDERKLTFRHYRDPQGKLGRQYKVGGIPCSFLLDKEGRIQAVHMGFSPALEQELSAEIEKLLKGETLAEPKPDDGKPAP